MNTLYLLAGILAAVTGLVHSVLGEYLIFRHLRNGNLVPSMDAPPLRERNIRIIWATWHLASVFGWAFAGILLKLAMEPTSPTALVLEAIVFANLGGAILVLVGTRGRHPGWIALLIVALLTWMAADAA
jgi:drug/metabolite transporter (DMT)-like permease